MLLIKLKYNIFDNAKTINYVFCPPVNAFSMYNQILSYCLKFKKDSIIIISLGPCGKILTYDLFKNGFRCLDLGHLIKDYDFWRRSEFMNNIEKQKEFHNFFKPDI